MWLVTRTLCMVSCLLYPSLSQLNLMDVHITYTFKKKIVQVATLGRKEGGNQCCAACFQNDFICHVWNDFVDVWVNVKLFSVLIWCNSLCGRFLTSWSGGTSTWRKVLRRRSRRWEDIFHFHSSPPAHVHHVKHVSLLHLPEDLCLVQVY